MSSLILHRPFDPFGFYNLYVQVNEEHVILGQDESVKIDLSPGNYCIKAGFRVLYKSKPYSISLVEGEEVELDIAANVDYNKPFDSLNWSLKFNNLYIISRMGESLKTMSQGSNFPTFPKYYKYMLALICLLPIAYTFIFPVTASNFIFVLLFPILSSLIYLSFGLKGNKFPLLSAESEMTSAIFFIIMGVISKLYVLYLVAGLAFLGLALCRRFKVGGFDKLNHRTAP